jgi:hypothetical protein
MTATAPKHAHPTSDEDIYKSIVKFMERTISCQDLLDSLGFFFGGSDISELPPLFKDDVVHRYELTHSVSDSIFHVCKTFGIETIRHIPHQLKTFQEGESLVLHYKKFLKELGQHADGLKECAFYLIANTGLDRVDFEHHWFKYRDNFCGYPDDLNDLIRDLKHEHEKYKHVSYAMPNTHICDRS